MARQSGGTVTIESAPDEGTTVRLYIPRAAPQRALRTERPQRADDQRISAGATGLVGGGDFSVRNFFADSLAGSGYRALPAPHGHAAPPIPDPPGGALPVH